MAIWAAALKYSLRKAGTKAPALRRLPMPPAKPARVVETVLPPATAISHTVLHTGIITVRAGPIDMLS